MSFDDLFALILFVVFVGLPLLNRMQQRGRPGAPPPGQGRPGVPGRPPGDAGRADRPGGGVAPGEVADASESEGSTRPRADDDPFAELARRLEEARRRVREATDGGQASAGTSASASPARTIATPAPPAAAIPDPRATAAPRAPRPAREPFPTTRPKPVSPWRERSESRASLRDDAPALEVERVRPVSMGSDRRSREVARLQAHDLVALDAQSFRKGIMWHMVLTGPIAYRNRRKPSRPASR